MLFVKQTERIENIKRVNDILNKLSVKKSKCCNAKVIYDAVGGYKYASTIKKCTNCGAKIFKELN